jgi:UDP-GlcNAc3NAcA epimerase
MPEEINRILTDHASDLLFAPTRIAYDRLLSEGIPEKKIVRTGDVMLDAARSFEKVAFANSSILSDLNLTGQSFVLCTLHRAENVDDPEILEWIVNGLNETSKEMPIVLPLHPRTKAKLKEFGLFEKISSAIKLIPPVGFLHILVLQTSSSLIVTDSGGMQKEAFFQKKPCVTVRTETEWAELLEGGHNRLARPMVDVIRDVAKDALEAHIDWSIELYGDGHSSETIADSLLKK